MNTVLTKSPRWPDRVNPDGGAQSEPIACRHQLGFAAVRRAIDVVGALVGIVLLTPVLLLIWIAIRLNPFCLLCSRPISVLKFRTIPFNDGFGYRRVGVKTPKLSEFARLLESKFYQHLATIRGALLDFPPEPVLLYTLDWSEHKSFLPDQSDSCALAAELRVTSVIRC
jgi:hypothetical protein